MKAIGNFLWFFTFGLVLGLVYFLLGVAFCATVIGIPFGIKYFHMSKFIFCPFGKYVDTNYEAHPIGNVVWLVLGGSVFATVYAILGAAFCVTIIGIPFGRQFFKFMKFSALPFGINII